MSSSVWKQCALCASSTHDVHHAIVGVNVVIGVLVVHCELLVVRVVPVVVCDDAVVRRTLVLIAFTVAFVFIVAIFAVLEVYCLHPPSVTVNCCWLLPNFELCTKLILRIIPRIIGPITVHQVSPINQCWVHRRGDAQMKNATRILASSTKMRKSFATFGNRLYLLGV